MAFACTDGVAQTSDLTAPSREAPPTASILDVMPDTAMFALAWPPLPKLSESLLMAAAQLQIVDDPATFLNALLRAGALQDAPDDVGDLGEFMSARGLAGDAPGGLFVDLSRTAEDAREVVDKCAEAVENNTLIGETKYRPPAYVFMLAVTDPRRAAAFVQDLLVSWCRNARPGYRGGGSPEELHWLRDDIAFCQAGAWIYVTNSEELVRAVIAKQAAPRPNSADSAAIRPSWAPDDIVVATRLDVLATQTPYLPAMLPYTDLMITAFTWAPTEISREKFLDYFAPSGGSAPLITTLSVSADRLELTSRLDLESHPKFRPQTDPGPLRNLSARIPSNHLLAAYVHWKDSLVAAVDCCFLLAPVEVQNLYLADLRWFLEQFASGETALAIVPGNPGAVQLYTGLSDTASAREFLRRNLRQISLDGLEETVFYFELASLELFSVMVDDVLITTNTRDQLPALAQAQQNGGAPFYERLSPPMPGDTIISAFSLQTADANALAAALSSFGVPHEMTVTLLKWLRPFREIRAGKYLQGDCQTQFLTCYGNP